MALAMPPCPPGTRHRDTGRVERRLGFPPGGAKTGLFISLYLFLTFYAIFFERAGQLPRRFRKAETLAAA